MLANSFSYCEYFLGMEWISVSLNFSGLLLLEVSVCDQVRLHMWCMTPIAQACMNSVNLF